MSSGNGRDLSVAELEQRRTAAVKHGGKSEPRVKAIATIQKRRLLRQIGLRLGDLDAVALGYLDLWARAQSKVELYDQWAGEHGYLNAAGSRRRGSRSTSPRSTALAWH